MPMDVMSLFRKQTPQQPNNQGPQGGQGNNPNANNGGQGQGNNNQQGGQGIQGPGTTPNGGGQGGANNGQQGNGQNSGNSPAPTGIDKFSKMWDTPDTQGDKAPTFNLDPKVLKEVASSQDFMQGVDPELMQKATSGDTQSLIQLMNNVAQSAYARSLEHGSTLTDKFVGAREGYSSKQLGSTVRGEMTNNALASSIPNFNKPAVQRQLKQTAEQLQRMHPDATPQEIVQMTIEYHQELAAAMAPEDKSKNGKPATAEGERGEEYWDQYFGADQS